MQTYEWLTKLEKPFILILNKCDQLPRKDWEHKRKALALDLNFELANIILFSSKTQEGAKQLWRWIEKM